MYYNKGNLFEYNECVGRGMCSIFPTIASFQEVMLIIFRTESYYILKLEKLGIDCSLLKQNIVNGISDLISTTGYSDEQLLNLIICNYNDLIKIRNEHLSKCKELGQSSRDIKLALRLSPEMSLSEVLSLGHKYITNKNNKMSSEQKCYSELLFVMIKSVSLSLVKLLDYKICFDSAVDNIIIALNTYNYANFSIKKAEKLIKKLAEIDLQLWTERQKAQTEKFGEVSKTSVSLSTTPGKSILVSGSSLNDLYNLLKVINDDSISVYTHGDLLIAHAFEKFRKKTNLKGHFGSFNDNCLLDFATFPGTILLTKHATQNIEFLIRGRLFTTDTIAPKGVVSIGTNEFETIISATNIAKGFSKGRTKNSIDIGYNSEDIEEKFNLISQKLHEKEIENLFIFGTSNFTDQQTLYFESFLNLLPQNNFVISFSHQCNCKNLLHINVANNFPLQLDILERLFNKIPLTADNIHFFVTKCDSNTISRMISLKEHGAKNIYLYACPPTVINPTVMNSFMKIYSIKPITSPKTDLNNIIKRAL